MNAEIDLLGGFAVRVDGRPIPATEWRRRRRPHSSNCSHWRPAARCTGTK